LLLLAVTGNSKFVVYLNRPLSSKEKTDGAYNIVDLNTDRREVSIRDRTLPTAPVKTFSYDKVFTGASKQVELYKAVVLPILEEVLLGYNCTVFALVTFITYINIMFAPMPLQCANVAFYVT